MVLEAKEVSYFYKNNKEKLILKGISMGFDAGKVYAILGPSGSGKTTFLSLLAGLDSPSRGQICYENNDISIRGLNHHRRHNISLVFQSYNLIDYLTPLENVMLGGKNNPAELLESVGIRENDHRRGVLQLSGGQQQRVAIARALASEAKVLLADEPTGNLDAATACDIIDILKRSAHVDGKSVIVVTHSKDLAAKADVVLRITDGTISADSIVEG